jgi:hypothetical protein
MTVLPEVIPVKIGASFEGDIVGGLEFTLTPIPETESDSTQVATPEPPAAVDPATETETKQRVGAGADPATETVQRTSQRETIPGPALGREKKSTTTKPK